MPGSFEEADLRSGLKEGGHILGAFIVARESERKFVVYVRTDWIRGRAFRIIGTWRETSRDRSFKNLDSAWRFVRRFGHMGRITVYPVGDSELRQFNGVRPRDIGDPDSADSPE